MTVSSTVNKTETIADGVADTFPYSFRIDVETDLVVYENGVVTALAYNVTGVGDEVGGTVVFNPTVPVNLVTVSNVREVPLLQNIDYTPFDPFPAEVAEQGLDRGVFVEQQLQEQISRALLAPIGTDPAVDYTFPPYEVGKGIMWSEQDPKQLVNSNEPFNQIVTQATAQADAAAVSAGTAATEAGNAATSAGQASTSASNAAASAVLAQDQVALAADEVVLAAAQVTLAEDAAAKANAWAEEAEDVPVEPGEFSALHWAAKSLDNASSALPLAGGTMTGPVNDPDNVANTGAIDLSTGNNFSVTPAGVITIDFAAPVNGQSGFIDIDNAGGHAITFGVTSTILQIGGTAPTLAIGRHLLGYKSTGTDILITSAEAFA